MLVIYLTDKAIYGLSGNSKNNKASISKSAVVPLNPQVVINGAIQDEESFDSSLSKLLSQFSKTKEVIFQVDSTTVIYRDNIVPKMANKALDHFVYYTLKAQIANFADYGYDYVVLPNTNDSKEKQLLSCAMPKFLIDGYKNILKKKGFTKIHITTSLISILQWQYSLPCVDNDSHIVMYLLSDMSNGLLFNGRNYIISNSLRNTTNDALNLLTQRINQLSQFQKAKDNTRSVNMIYLAGENIDENVVEGIKNFFGIETKMAISEEGYGEIGGMKAVGLIGALMPLTKTLDLANYHRFDNYEKKPGTSKISISKLILINFLVVLLLLLGAFGCSWFFNHQVKELNKKLEDEQFNNDYYKAREYGSEIDTLDGGINEAGSFPEYLSTTKLIGKKKIDYIKSLAENVNFNSIAITGYSQITINCSSKDRQASYLFIEKLKADAQFTNVVYNGFDFSRNTYSYTVSFNIQEVE